MSIGGRRFRRVPGYRANMRVAVVLTRAAVGHRKRIGTVCRRKMLLATVRPTCRFEGNLA